MKTWKYQQQFTNKWCFACCVNFQKWDIVSESIQAWNNTIQFSFCYDCHHCFYTRLRVNNKKFRNSLPHELTLLRCMHIWQYNVKYVLPVLTLGSKMVINKSKKLTSIQQVLKIWLLYDLWSVYDVISCLQITKQCQLTQLHFNWPMTPSELFTAELSC